MVQHSRNPLPALGLLAVAAVVAGCASSPRNYLDPDGPLYQGSYSVAPSPRPEIRVVTFNIEYGIKVDQAIQALTSQPALQGPDVLLLQEMDAPGVEAIAKVLTMNYAYCPSSVNPKTKRDVGTAVLSPWPMPERFKVRLPHLARMSGHARSVVGARVRIDGRDVRVYSIHFGTLLGLSGSQRREQLQAVVDDASKSSDPVLVGGDFNSKGLAEHLASSGYAWPTRDTGKTWKVFAFDHILTRGMGDLSGARSGVAREVRGASDHYPLWLTFPVTGRALTRAGSRLREPGGEHLDRDVPAEPRVARAPAFAHAAGAERCLDHRPPRPQAREREGDARGQGEGARLRPGESLLGRLGRGLGAGTLAVSDPRAHGDRGRCHPRHRRLHVARAGARQAG